jgi:hypothetical protein
MNELAVGDRVKVITDRWDRSNFTQYGKVGTIHSLYNSGAKVIWYSVSLDDGEEYNSRYNYTQADIELIEEAFEMPDPEMDLDEIHLAQELVK